MTPCDETVPNRSEDDEAVATSRYTLGRKLHAIVLASSTWEDAADAFQAALRAAGFVVARESALIAERDAAKEREHYANGVADLAMQHRDEAEAALTAALAERDAARAKLQTVRSYYLSYAHDEASERECCIDDAHHLAAQAFRDAVAAPPDSAAVKDGGGS